MLSLLTATLMSVADQQHDLAAAERCSARLLPTAAAPGNRSLSARTLIELVDLGHPSPFYQSLKLSISPDGSRAAVPIRRADIATNGYCIGFAIVDLKGRHSPTLIGLSDELVSQDYDWRGPILREEAAKVVEAKWSPKGDQIAFEKRSAGLTRLWVADLSSGQERPIDGATGSLGDFGWGTDSQSLFARQTLLSEPPTSETGYRYGARFLPVAADGPLPIATAQVVRFDINLETGLATKSIEPRQQAGREGSGSMPAATSSSGSTVRVVALVPGSIGSATTLVATAHGKTFRCDPAECGSAEGLWWADDRTIIFERRAGWASEKSSVVRWRLGQKPITLRIKDDVLSGCALGHAELICGQESSASPRRIVGIDLGSGQERIIFEPNAAFADVSHVRTRRLYLTNALGIRSFADLVYPSGYVPGQRYPLIVTTYESRGFLRGGTGDEYPVPLFAQKGFMVLSFQRPRDVGMGTAAATSPQELGRLETADWADRRSVQSSLEVAIDTLIARKLVDPRRIGISGLSDGATTAIFALLNSKLFSAAAISNCCMEREALLSLTGPSNAAYFRSIGYPSISAKDDDFWRHMSLIDNARTIEAPILMQLGSAEARMALGAHAALAENDEPIDLIVYPSEGHVKRQPRHRLAVYDRNIAWFEFWLKGEVDQDLIDEDDLKIWTGLRDKVVSRQTAH